MFGKEMLDTVIIAPTISIRASAQLIQNADVKILLVCDADRRLLGTVTDGDIRRAVMESLDLDAGVETIMNRSPKTARAEESVHVVRARMSASTIRHMPQIDERGRLFGLILLDQSYDMRERESRVVLMAGGRGRRLMPLTEDTPKPLLKVGAKPVIERQIEMLIGQGFRRFSVSLNYLGHMIEDYLGSGERYGVEIDYLREEEPLGTCGALCLMEPQDHPVLVMNGDIMTRADCGAMQDFFENASVAATMGVREYTYTVPYGCVTLEDGLIENLEEKPTFRHLVSAGIYILAPDTLQQVPADRYLDMPQLFEALIASGRSANSFLISEEWIDIGRKEDLDWARTSFVQEDRFE